MEIKVYIGKTLFSRESSQEKNRKTLEEDLTKFVYKISGVSRFKYIKAPSGKPIILEPEGWHFNISHKQEIGVFALSNIPIGVDIEEVCKKNRTGIAKEFYTPDEYNFSLENRVNFYHIWSRKEAYIKQKGHSVWDMAQVPELLSNLDNIKTWELPLADKTYSLSICIDEGADIKPYGLPYDCKPVIF